MKDHGKIFACSNTGFIYVWILKVAVRHSQLHVGKTWNWKVLNWVNKSTRQKNQKQKTQLNNQPVITVLTQIDQINKKIHPLNRE